MTNGLLTDPDKVELMTAGCCNTCGNVYIIIQFDTLIMFYTGLLEMWPWVSDPVSVADDRANSDSNVTTR